jgi:probable phosphoglycerate mutase
VGSLIIWRHGRTSWNVEGRYQGHADIDLDETGVAQAERSAEVLAQLGIDVIVSSDLRRARETAARLAELTGLEVRTDPRLREFDVGMAQGLRRDEIAARFPVEYASLRNEGLYLWPGAETAASVAARMTAAMSDAVAAVSGAFEVTVESRGTAGERARSGPCEGGRAVIVTHGASARIGIAAMLGLPRAYLLGGLDNCHWCELLPAGRSWRLGSFNTGVRTVVPAV